MGNEFIKYEVLNYNGQEILSGDLRDSKTIDLSSKSKGLYFIRFKSEKNVQTRKVIVN
jgi:hypothetical protein